jgi:hypothetical protein
MPLEVLEQVMSDYIAAKKAAKRKPEHRIMLRGQKLSFLRNAQLGYAPPVSGSGKIPRVARLAALRFGGAGLFLESIKPHTARQPGNSLELVFWAG